MTIDSNKGNSTAAQKALRKIVDRLAGVEDFGLTKDEQLELMRLTHERTLIFFVDYKFIIEKVNSAARKMLAEPERSLIGIPFSNFVTPEDQGIYFGGIKNTTTKSSPSSFSMRIVRAEDEEFHAHVQVEPKFEPTGKFSHWHLAFFDVSAEKLSDRRIKEVHEQLQMAAQAAELGIWNYDLKSGTTRWNVQLYRLLGLEPGEGPEDGQRFFDFIHPDDRSGTLANLQTILKSEGDKISEEFRVVRADGKTRWLAARGRIYRDADGRPERISGINYDITSRKKAEETIRLAQLQLSMQLAETERVNEELSQYAYAVSHDLKGPLRAIRNYAEFLYEDLADTLTGEQKKYLEGLKRAVDQGDTLINDLLNLSRIDRAPLEMEAADVPAVVGEIATRSASRSAGRRPPKTASTYSCATTASASNHNTGSRYSGFFSGCIPIGTMRAPVSAWRSSRRLPISLAVRCDSSPNPEKGAPSMSGCRENKRIWKKIPVSGF